MAALLTAAVYLAAAKLGLSMADVAAQVTTVWPPTGIALAAVLLVGPRVWPGIALGAFLANLTAPHESILTASGIAAGNTLEALIGAWLMRSAGFRPSLERLRDVFALLVLGAWTSTTVAATIGVTSLCLGGVHPWTRFATLWWTWWIGDAIGALVVAPLLLAWGSGWRVHLGPRRLAEAAALGSTVIAVSLTVFAGPLGRPVTGYPLHYAIFPLVIWGALRFGPKGVTIVTVTASALAIWSTLNGWGPFAVGSLHERLVLLQVFMAVVTVTGLLLAGTTRERDRAEERGAEDYARLGLSEERLRLALQAGRMGVWDWNIATGAVKWSENLESIHGLAPGSFAGTFEAFQALIHPDDRDVVNRTIRDAVDSGTGYDIEFRNQWPDGSVHWMSARGRVLSDPSGRPLRMIGVGADVTPRRHLEEELRRRVQELADDDRRKDEFLAMLAHELRNPLAPLSTALHLLAVGADNRERFLSMADRQVKQLVRLVDDLLDVSRITQGKIALRKEVVELNDVVGRAVEMARQLVDARGHALTVSLPPEPVQLEADPARLAQVLGNLLSNAANYTPPGGSIWLTAERIDADLVIRVRDTGAGLAPDLLPHVFDLFVQGDTSLDRTRGGLGIGLTIVRRLVELHGGRVEVRSPGLGRGSEFTVRLPAIRPALPGESSALPATDGSEARPLAILVVEDNEDAAEALAMVLRLWGHDVRVAYDAAAALEAAEGHPPDVIVSDLGLPGVNGYDLARQLRQRPAFGSAVLIALSGYGRDDDRRRALEAGFDHHLVKPPDLDALAHLLGRVAASAAEQPRRTLH